MYTIELNCLVEFFESINESFDYVVMRNAVDLPYENQSNDIDILINQTEWMKFENVMKTVLVKHGFDRVERASYHGIECYTFYNRSERGIYSLKLDLFFNVEGGGVRYYEFKDLIRYKRKNKHGIFVLEGRVENYITALKTVSAGGLLKKKYLQDYIDNSIDWNHELVRLCPSKTLVRYLEEIGRKKTNLATVSRRKIICETLYANFLRNPLESIGMFLNHYNLEVKRAFRKQYIIVFVGPDGSGKTTLIQKLREDSRAIFKSRAQRFSVFHHRPHLLPNISQAVNQKFTDSDLDNMIRNPHSGEPSGPLVSLVKTAYYICDYSLGYLWKLVPMQRQNKFIIFDRYFFDFIVDQKRSAINLPKGLVKILYSFFVPKPNKVFFIKVSPQLAHERKGELSVDTIRDINNDYDLLEVQWSYFKAIENVDLDRAYDKLLREIIDVITEKV